MFGLLRGKFLAPCPALVQGETIGKAGALAELVAMQAAYSALEALSDEGRSRAVAWLADTLEIVEFKERVPSPARGRATVDGDETGDDVHAMEPKEFMSSKKPKSQMERVACLAYYLLHHRNMRHFKTGDVGALNTEAAGQKFGNLSRDVDNTDRHGGYIVSAGGGSRQLTTRGEAVVDALPNRDAVKLALQEHPYRLKRSTGNGKKAGGATGDEE